MEALSEALDESADNSSLVKSEDGSPRNESGRSSPPPNCAICLGRCRNKSFTDSCLHQFCFKCLVTWSRVKTECPLCKQNFKSIIHNVKSNHTYEEYPVQQSQNDDSDDQLNRNINEMVNAATRRFRYRTTLTLPRRETLAIQQFLLHYPLSALMRGVPQRPISGAMRPPRRSPADFRRTVYRHNLWARPLPDFTGRFRDCTPDFFRYNDSQIHRLIPWLNRELYYLLNENSGHISYVLERILELLREHSIISPVFRAAMHCYFGDRTEHFLHEFYCFASTPYDITGYDRHVQYQTDSRVSAVISEVLSSSDSDSRDSDIVMVSSSHPAPTPAAAAPAAGPSRAAAVPAPVYPRSYIPEPAVIPIETISPSNSDSDSSVMVVGYIKPPHQRTPELVDLLGSDSDVVVQDAGAGGSGDAVRLTLSRPRRPVSMEANVDSDSDNLYVPSLLKRRRRRARASPSTAEPPSAPPSPPLPILPPPATPPFSSDDEDSYEDTTDESSSSYDNRRSKAKRKTKRKSTRTASSRSGGRSKRRSPKQRKDKKKSEADKEKKRKDKSRNGKNVKSSKDTLTVAPLPSELESAPAPAPVYDQPGPSGIANARKRKSSSESAPRRGSRESKRLKSVVKVMKKVSESSASAGSSVSASSGGTRDRYRRKKPHGSSRAKNRSRSRSDNVTNTDCTSSSDDNIPLHLTINK